MSLYHRNLANYSYNETLAQDTNRSFEESFINKAKSERAVFLRQTYQLLAASLLAATAGAYLGTQVIKTFSWILLIAEFAFLIGLSFSRKNPPIALVMLFGFTFVSGMTLGPILNTLMGAGMGNIITQAFLMTTVAFGGLSLFAMNTKHDFSSMGKFLFIALIIVVVGGLINIFIGNSMFALGISCVSAILFSGYILYDTQQIVRGNVDSPIMAAVALYIDILNLFVSLLHILSALNGRK